MTNRITKRQMKEDTFIATMIRAWEYVREHERAFFAGLIVLVLIAALAGWSAYARREARAKASSRFADALASYRSGDLKTAEELFGIVVKQHRGLQEGAFSQYFLGKCALDEGRNSDAVTAFDEYLKRAGRHPFFHDAAMEGKAVALENDRQYQAAAEVYVELAKTARTNAFMETTYLRRAAENFRSANATERAIEILSALLDKTKGTERRDIEVEIEMLRG